MSLSRTLIGLFFFSVIIRLALLGALLTYGGNDAIVLGDGIHYVTVAQNIADGEGVFYDGVLESYRPPGYSFYLLPFAYFKLPLYLAVIPQILVASLFPVCVFLLCRRLAVSYPFSLGAGILASIEPVQLFYSVVILADVYFSMAVLVAAYSVVRWIEVRRLRFLISAGVAIAVANYMRGAAIYLPYAFIVFGAIVLLLRREATMRSLAPLALIPLTALLVMAPWYIRNNVVFGVSEFVSSKGIILYSFAPVAITAKLEGRTYEVVKEQFYTKARTDLRDDNLTSFKNQSYLVEKSKEIIFAHPFLYLENYLLGLNTFWFSGNYHQLLVKYGVIAKPERSISYSLVLSQQGPVALVRTIFTTLDWYVVIAILGKAFWFALGVLAAIGLWLRRRTPEAWMAFLLAAYCSATILVPTIGVEARHRYALNPLMIAFAAVAVHSGFSMLTSFYWNRRGKPLEQ
jgi:hypothetical protein